MDRGALQATVHGLRKELDTTEGTSTAHMTLSKSFASFFYVKNYDNKHPFSQGIIVKYLGKVWYVVSAQ